MAELVNLTNLANLQNETTAVTAINANNSAITTAFNDVLSRSGTAPNQMQSTLDMNNNRIINLPAAISTTEPVTLAQMGAALVANGNINTGLTGVPVSAAMQPVVNAVTTAAAVALLGIPPVPTVSSAMVPIVTASTQNIALQTLLNSYSVATDPTDLTPETSPSGENQEGKTWSWDPNNGGSWKIRHPKIFFGPMAMTTGTTGNLSIPVYPTWKILTTNVPFDGIGFRGGMSAYVPKGRYGIQGFVTVSSTASNNTFYIQVTQGLGETDPTNQPNIAIGTPIVVGEGTGTATSANFVYSIPFEATDIQYAGAPNHACEILVQISAAASGGTALASSGPTLITSRGRVQRWDGEYGTS